MENHRNLKRAAVVTAALITAAFATLEIHAAETAQLDRDFTLKVYSLLKEKCFACHGDDPAKIKGELNLLTREAMLKGGEYSDKVLVPGNAEESDLYIAVTWRDEDLEMPPKENDRLNEEQISVLRDWINNGAIWPDEETQKKISRGSVVGRRDGRRRDHSNERRARRCMDISALQARGHLGVPSSGEAGGAR